MNPSYQNQQEMDPVADLLAGEHPVAYRVCFARVCGGACSALLLSQFYYWSSTVTAQARDGWFFMTQAQITEQTGLTIRETETARKRLREAGVLQEEKRGLPMKLWFRVEKNALYRLLRAHVEGDAEARTNLPQNVEDGANAPDPNLQQNVEDCFDKSAAHFSQNVEDCSHGSAPDLRRNVGDITKSSSETPSEISTETTTTQPTPTPELPVVVSHSDEDSDSTLHLVAEIVKSQSVAQSIIREVGEPIAHQQALWWPERSASKSAHDPGAVFRAACRQNWPAPTTSRQPEPLAKRRYVTAPTPEPTPAPIDCEAEYLMLSSDDKTALQDDCWEVAIQTSPAPIRARIEAASKSQEPPSAMIQAILRRYRNTLLAERREAKP